MANDFAIYDVIVIGLGGMGSSALYNVAKNNLKVLGLEQFKTLHTYGSSHGESRIFRKAYFENEKYIPLLNRSYDLFKELEKISNEELFKECGLALYGDAKTSNLFKNSVENAKAHDVPLEILTPQDSDKTFTNYNSHGMHCAFERTAGLVRPEKTIEVMLKLAKEKGAEVKENETVLEVKSIGSIIEVTTDHRVYVCKKLIVTAGPWTTKLLSKHNISIRLKKMILYWFKLNENYNLQINTPCFGFDVGHEFFYGFPSLDGISVKMAAHVSGEEILTPEEKELNPMNSQHLKDIQMFLSKYLKGVTEDLVKTQSCTYSLTPDENFIIDELPGEQNIILACGFSGHGFKFTPVIGEILADKILARKSNFDLSFLELKRFKDS